MHLLFEGRHCRFNYNIGVNITAFVWESLFLEYNQRRKKVQSYLPQYDFLVVFGAVSVSPHNEGHVLVYVQVASPLAKPASTQSQ